MYFLYKTFSIYKITPLSTHRKVWSTSVVRGSECFVGLSILLVYGRYDRVYTVQCTLTVYNG